MSTINTAAMILRRVNDPYRGQGVATTQFQNNAKDILEAASLNWRVGQAKLAMVGKSETRGIDGYVANVRSDNGKFLSISTTDYKPHHNVELVGTMAKFASQAGLTITRVGHFDGGTRIWAVAESEAMTGEVAKGDIIRNQIVMRSGHEPGVASIFRAMALRLACLNGMTVSESRGQVRFIHSAGLTSLRTDQVAAFMSRSQQGFTEYLNSMRRLYDTPSSPLVDRLMLMELVAPQLIGQVHDRLHRVNNTRPASSTPLEGDELLTDILRQAADREDSLSIVRELIDSSSSRTAKLLDEVLDTQRGGQHSRGTMAHVVNAASAYATHLRGRTDEGGVESNLFGVGGDLANDALQVATRWSQVLETAAR